MKLTNYIGKELEYLGGYPREEEYKMKVGQKYFIKDVYGCCFLIEWDGGILFGQPHMNQAVIHFDRFIKSE